jgi:hypothetical protein
MDFLRRTRPASGAGTFSLRLGGVRLDLLSTGEELARRIEERFGVYSGSTGEAGEALRVEMRDASRDYFIDPPARSETNPVLLACDGARVRYLGYRVAGWFDVGPGDGGLVLARGRVEPAHRAVENFIRAAGAWDAVSLGGALVHAASAVREGKAYLFYGESGAGKSTLAAACRSARVVSDDLSLVLPDDAGRLELVGSPFRGTYEEGEPVTGRFPLEAGFRIVKDRRASVRPVARIRALAELVGNLPFVADSLRQRPDLFDRVGRAFRDVPLAHLHFARGDDGYWDAIAGAGLTP